MREHFTVDSDGLRLAVTASGPRDAPVLLLVHGYPDSKRVWEPVRALLDTRFRVIAYDVRGAGESQAPAGRLDYGLAALARDLDAVARATCGERAFHLAAHDWGSVQSWEAVTSPTFSGRIASFTSISGPCLDHASLALRDESGKPSLHKWIDGIRQFVKSWYIYAFHVPGLAELFWKAGGARSWPRFLTLMEGVHVERDPAQRRNALNGLGLYRANFLPAMLHPRERYAHARVQFIVPMRDRYVAPALSLGLEPWLGAYQRDEVDARHWVLLRDPALIAKKIEAFALSEMPVEAKP